MKDKVQEVEILRSAQKDNFATLQKPWQEPPAGLSGLAGGIFFAVIHGVTLKLIHGGRLPSFFPCRHPGNLVEYKYQISTIWVTVFPLVTGHETKIV